MPEALGLFALGIFAVWLFASLIPGNTIILDTVTFISLWVIVIFGLLVAGGVFPAETLKNAIAMIIIFTIPCLARFLHVLMTPDTQE